MTEVDETTDTSAANAGAASVLGDTDNLVSELNAEGGDVSGAVSQTVNAENCTSNTIISNSNRGIAGVPCVGVTGDACEFECDEGFTKFGEHVCNPDGKFCEINATFCNQYLLVCRSSLIILHLVQVALLTVSRERSWRRVRPCRQGAFPMWCDRRSCVRQICGVAATAARLDTRR